MTDPAQQAAEGAAKAVAQAAQVDAQRAAPVVLPKDQDPPALPQPTPGATTDQDQARNHVEKQLQAEGYQFHVKNPPAPAKAPVNRVDAPDVTR